ncbi:hypothetical protein AIOL_000620 [Candidatus Rhodobacter oscarellae]|uniref:Lipoprotein n=1 Tax=Candidatus Rhodobacter oscarellae TaxID=1675527 RepID=A0A0J9EFK6_9RHOB|nr:hypothetical protein [Candidatus Rhodobacter lobularis]KMW60464.1 hypothetical protein AIOL_000620 [Candidatus Rhodobacter lobularis]
MRTAGLFIIAALVLAACGGGGYRSVDRFSTPRTLFATGPIYAACLRADRKAASRSLCGCVQAVANQHLRGGDISLAASFYADPHQAQVVRQSDRPSNERFWRAYKVYAEAAERQCG